MKQTEADYFNSKVKTIDKPLTKAQIMDIGAMWVSSIIESINLESFHNDVDLTLKDKEAILKNLKQISKAMIGGKQPLPTLEEIITKVKSQN